ncbi:C-terminal binding protein [Haloferax sp. DFSO52]|uniref:C-terminal binding protein n=1 Tax=Haloferax sp. DFSO52 TaxID=3388505 RepID=UPI003A8B078B
MASYTVVVTDHDFENLDIEREVLGDIADLVTLTDDVGQERNDAADVLAAADGVLNLRYDIGADLVSSMESCRIIARYGIGVDNVATDTARELSIPVTNVPDYCLEEVSTHALSLLLSLNRGVTTYDASVETGAWDRDVAAPLSRLSSQTVGIVGFGAIGRAVAERLAGFGVDIITSDPFLSAEDLEGHDAELVSFEQLLGRADYITIHSPLTDGTRGLFGPSEFEQMKETAALINVARGPIVQGDALRDALDAGEIAGAGLDVFPTEPPAPDDALRTHDNVVTTPHVAWYSEEANAERRRAAAQNVRAALEGEAPENVVNGVE